MTKEKFIEYIDVMYDLYNKGNNIDNALKELFNISESTEIYDEALLNMTSLLEIITKDEEEVISNFLWENNFGQVNNQTVEEVYDILSKNI